MRVLRRASAAWLAAAIVGWSGCSHSSSGGPGVATVVHGSGNVVEEDRPVSGFTRLLYRSEGAVRVEQGAGESLRVRADDNLLQYLTSVVQGGTLRMATAPNVDLRPTQAIEWFLTVASLEDIDLGGIGNLDVSDLTARRLALTCSGVGDAVLADLTATELVVEAGGLGGVRASGAVDLQTVTLPLFGFGAYEAGNLQSREAHVQVRGAADATVRVSDRLFVTITGSGSVYYYGSPTVDATITGSGQVVQLGPSPAASPLWLVGSRPLGPMIVWNPGQMTASD